MAAQAAGSTGFKAAGAARRGAREPPCEVQDALHRALMHSVQQGDTQGVLRALAKGAVASARGSVALRGALLVAHEARQDADEGEGDGAAAWWRNDMVRLLLQWGAQPSDALVFEAADGNGEHSVVAALLEMGADPSVLGGAPLALAAAHTDQPDAVVMVRTLLAAGAGGSKEALSWALSVAVRQPPAFWSVRVVTPLLEAGANVHVPWKGVRPLTAAAGAGNASMVRLLLEHGADGGADEGAALTAAAAAGSSALVDLLLPRAGGPAGAPAAAALLAAAGRGQWDAVDTLVRLGVSLAPPLGPAALEVATLGGHEPVRQWLLQGGLTVAGDDLAALHALEGVAEEAAKPTTEGVLAAAAMAEDVGTLNRLLVAAAGLHEGGDAVADLLQVGAQDTDPPGRALRAAAAAGNDSGVVALTMTQAYPAGTLEVALLAAARRGRTGVIDALLRTGQLDLQADGLGERAVVVAAQSGHTDAVMYLLRKEGGALPLTTGDYAAVRWDAVWGAWETLYQLLAWDCIPRRTREAALVNAVRGDHPEAVALLLATLPGAPAADTVAAAKSPLVAAQLEARLQQAGGSA